MKSKAQMETARPRSFKQRLNDLVESVQTKAVAAAVKLGFKAGPRLRDDVQGESDFWSAIGYQCPNRQDEAPRGLHWSRAVCLDVLLLFLDLEGSFGEEVSDWSDWIDESLNALRARLDEAGPPPSLDVFSAWIEREAAGTLHATA
jgi:hypothetical protein